MKIGRFLKYFAGLVAILAVAAVVVLAAVDFNDYKPELTAQVKQATGRDLSVKGDIKLALSLTPALAVSGVSFANAEWGSRPAMATVDQFEVQVALIPLLSGTIDVQSVVLKGADILLETDAEGRPNYVFEAASKPETVDNAAPTIPVIRKATIENARITHKDGVTGTTSMVIVKSLSMQSDGSGPITLSLAGSYNEAPFALSGTVGSASDLVAGNRPYPVTVAVEAGGAKIRLEGAVSDIQTRPVLDFKLSVEGKNMADLAALVGKPVPALGPYTVEGQLKGDPGATLTLSDFAATVGGSDLSGTMTVDLRHHVPSIDATLKSTRLDVADFVKPGEPDAAAAEAKDDGRVFPDDPLPLDGLKNVDAILKISIGTLIAALEAKDVEIGLHLKSGDLRVAPLKATLTEGAIDGAVRLNAAAEPALLESEIKIRKFDAGKFLTDMAITDLLEGRLNADINVKGQGKSIRAIMAGLGGRTQVAMGKGKMKSTALETFISGPTKVLSKIFTGNQSEFTTINCMVSQFDIKKGLATSKVLLFDTEYATISGKGTVNLATEALDLEVDPQPKSATINTAVPIVIRGTFAAPSYGVSELAAARKVGGLLSVFVFPPAMILGLAETGTGEENPCLKGGKQKPAPQQAAPEKAEESNPITQPLKSIEKGVGGVLKKLFGN